MGAVGGVIPPTANPFREESAMSVNLTLMPNGGVSKSVTPPLETSLRYDAAGTVTPTSMRSAPRTKEVREVPSIEESPSGMNPTEAALETVKAAQESAKEEREKVEALASQLNDVMETFHKRIRFRIDKELGQPYVQVVNVDTGEVIRTIPPQEILELMARMRDALGMILDIEI